VEVMNAELSGLVAWHSACVMYPPTTDDSRNGCQSLWPA